MISFKYIFLSIVPPYWAILLASFLGGVAAGPINPVLSAIEFERIPANMRGRVLGAITAVAWVAIPLGMLVGGFALEWVDVRLVLLVTGLCYLATVVSFLFHPAAREMNIRVGQEAS